MALIAISRQMGAFGDEIARDVARSLSYTYIDKENIFGVGERFGLRQDELEKLDEKKPSLRDRIFKDRVSLYKNLLQSIIFQFARNGEAVIVGGGAYLILKDIPGTLRIKVIAPVPDRMKRVMAESGVTADEAASLINRSDTNRAGFMKHVFDTDWMDAVKYDLVLNTGRVGREEACRVVIGAATSDRMQEESKAALGLLQRVALARKVETMLLTNKRVDARYVSVSVDEAGVVVLKGMVNSEAERQLVESLAKSAEETKRVVNDVVVSVVPAQSEPM